MLLSATSIRGKIASGFVATFLFLLLVASVLFVSLHVAEDEVDKARDPKNLELFAKQYLARDHRGNESLREMPKPVVVVPREA